MPRPNRYHPYTRNGTSPPMMSSRLNPQLHSSVSTYPATSLAQPQHMAQAHVLTTISEQAPIPNFQHIPATYIRAQTSDGQDLVPRSILQGPDGTFHVQMQIVRYPSEGRSPRFPDLRLRAMISAASCVEGESRPPTPYMAPGMGMTLPNAGGGKGYGSDSGYSDSTSPRSGRSQECVYEDVDAEGEDEDEYENALKDLVQRQQHMIDGMKGAAYGVINVGLAA